MDGGVPHSEELGEEAELLVDSDNSDQYDTLIVNLRLARFNTF